MFLTLCAVHTEETKRCLPLASPQIFLFPSDYVGTYAIWKSKLGVQKAPRALLQTIKSGRRCLSCCCCRRLLFRFAASLFLVVQDTHGSFFLFPLAGHSRSSAVLTVIVLHPFK